MNAMNKIIFNILLGNNAIDIAIIQLNDLNNPKKCHASVVQTSNVVANGSFEVYLFLIHLDALATRQS